MARPSGYAELEARAGLHGVAAFAVAPQVSFAVDHRPARPRTCAVGVERRQVVAMALAELAYSRMQALLRIRSRTPWLRGFRIPRSLAVGESDLAVGVQYVIASVLPRYPLLASRSAGQTPSTLKRFGKTHQLAIGRARRRARSPLMPEPGVRRSALPYALFFRPHGGGAGSDRQPVVTVNRHHDEAGRVAW